MALKIHNILLLTSIYPGPDIEKESTPVVHYFTREWVKAGYNVVVMHFPANFPELVMKVASLFRSAISSKSGAVIRTRPVADAEYEIDGVRVRRIPLLKYKPHGKFTPDRINIAIRRTIEYCSYLNFRPDVVISHWANPQLEIMSRLKDIYHVPTCYVAHLRGHDLLGIYSQDKARALISKIDLIGFRSDYIKREFEVAFDYRGLSFLCYSGIPSRYLSPLEPRKFGLISRFIFVGTLIERKYPAQIVQAVHKAFGSDHFTIDYIGRGAESKKILACARKLKIEERVHLLGFMNREQVVAHLRSSDVFVMISRRETFGLVYLEAMAAGCITIASRNEGFDGIIRDGVNGFLCQAGNQTELAEIIAKIRMMPPEVLQRISMSAIETAHELTEEKAARKYLEALESIG